MAETEGYSPRNRAERVISLARVFLAVVLTGAVLFASPEPRRYNNAVPILALGYLVYSFGVAALTWTRRITTRGVPIATHVIDLAVFSMLLFLTHGDGSPFFAYFIFAIICGAIRWFGRGAILTGIAALITYAVATLSGEMWLPSDDFNTPEFIARCAQLALVAGLLGYLGTFHHRLQREIASLSAWPRRLPGHGPDALQEVLGYAATVLGTPRIIVVWEEHDEPALRIAISSGDDFSLSHERPDAFGTLVAEDLARSSFVCTGCSSGRPKILQRVPGGFRYWTGESLDRTFRSRFDVKDVIALRLSTDSIDGWLFALERPRASADDVLLGDIVGRLVASTLELQTLIYQLRETAAGEERVNLARELHDGVLQSLTAASLQAQRARQSVAMSPAEAERRIARVEETILAEQQALRLAIEDLKPGAMKASAAVDLVPRLRETATRVARQWEIRTHLNLQPGLPPIPQRTAHELTRMLQEALVNAIRHGSAKEVTVTCINIGPNLVLSVSYQGRGFSGFQGRHDLASLNRMKAGPRTLKERVSAVGGALVIETSEGGARVEIEIPLTAAP